MSSTHRAKNSSTSKPKPAFAGAKFDKEGNCLKHRSVQLAEQVEEDGKIWWDEIRKNCPKCIAEHHKSRRVTSLGGKGKIKKGRVIHGMSDPLRDTKKSGRHMDTEFDTPFDDKGRCHHHPNVQMATKKSRGGWKILIEACPRCIEARHDEDVESLSSRGLSSRSLSSRGSSKYGGRDDESVDSRSSKKSVTRHTKAVTSCGKFDKNGCCTRHPTVQVAKKKMLGGWKTYRDCPKCVDPNFDIADDISVASGSSHKSGASFRSRGSTRSRKSTKNFKSNASRKGGGKTDRYGALPFDESGYCHTHPHVRLAKKKAMGGWKLLQPSCPECEAERGSVHSRSSRRSKSSRRSSGTGRYFDDSGSLASSCKSGKSTGSRKKKIRVKNMKYQDENGKEGRYSGDVDEDHQPNGQGKMKYKDGSSFKGVWSEGSQAHGKWSKSSRKDKSSTSTRKDEWKSKESKKLPEESKKPSENKKQDNLGNTGAYMAKVDSSARGIDP